MCTSSDRRASKVAGSVGVGLSGAVVAPMVRAAPIWGSGAGRP